jgi:hemolysin III
VNPGEFTPWLGVSDPVAAGTHFVGAIASAAGTLHLRRRAAGDLWRSATLSVFGGSMVTLFTASAAYHTAFPGPLKYALLRRLDHASIYLLIAGTFTAIAGNLVNGWFRVFVLGTVWPLALVGAALKLFLFGVAPEWLDTTLYLTLGWFGVVPFIPILRGRSRRVVVHVFAPAVIYSIGALCELFGWPILIEHVFGYHEVFHLCVLLAAALFYTFVLENVVPISPSQPSAATPAVSGEIADGAALLLR